MSPITPDDAGMDPARLERLRALCRAATESGEVPGLALTVARDGCLVLNEAWGRAGPSPDAPPATAETVWLAASVTKPVVCAGVCLLMERGELLLDDPVSRFIPEFGRPDRAETTLRHLLTHTSGLPDMLPENAELRRGHAPPEEFVARICETPLLFPPGTDVRYQSTGIALLAVVIERVSGLSCREFLRREFFLPLGMDSCALGWRPEFQGRAAECVLAKGQEPSDWDWNSAYWREFGAAWGGMYATAPEFARFMQMLIHGGEWEGRRYLAPATVLEMTRNQSWEIVGTLEALSGRAAAWGLGWRLPQGADRGPLPDLGSDAMYGHSGATGTGVWNHPGYGLSFVFFSNQPRAGRWIRRAGNLLLAAING